MLNLYDVTCMMGYHINVKCLGVNAGMINTALTNFALLLESTNTIVSKKNFEIDDLKRR